MRLVVTALLALGLLCPVGEALAQQTGTIRGRVVDATTSQPLSVTEVIVTGTSFSTITDENGAFQLVGVPAGLYSVEARRIGYARSREGMFKSPLFVIFKSVTNSEIQHSL